MKTIAGINEPDFRSFRLEGQQMHLTSGLVFLSVEVHYRETIEGALIIAAVITDQHRQRKGRTA
jgi:hypothetical protein